MINIPKERLELDSHKFHVGLVIALAIHVILILAPIAFWLDINLFKYWSVALVQQGITNFYSFTNSDYPPAYMYVLWLVGKIYQLFDPAFSHTDRVGLMALIKLPPVLADIGSAFLIAQILKAHTSSHNAYKIGLIYAFNPLMLFISAVWGQVDSAIVFLMLAAVYLLQQNYAIAAGTLITTMVIVKPQGLFLAPFFLLSQWFRQPWWKWIAIAACSLALIWSIAEPFFGIDTGITNPFLSLYYRLQSTANLYSLGSVNAFNIWIWMNWQPDDATFLGITYKVIGLISLGILMAWLGVFLYLQRSFAPNSLAIAIMLIGCFMLPTRMHERYMLYSLAFLAIAIALIPALQWLYWAFTLTGSINVGYVYFRYNYTSLFDTIPELWMQSMVYIVSGLNAILLLILISQTFRWQSLSEAPE
jgi:Gpi18-like mannosyltransferase